MSASEGRRRAVLVAITVALLAVAGPVWPVAAQPGVRPPGTPPPVNPAELPTQLEVNALPYVVNNTATQQVGPPQPTTACVQQSPDTAMDAETEPANQNRLRIQEAHQFATGRDQVVAVIDSGVNRHPLLSDRLFDGGDYIENRSGLYDCDGHGTVVAGLIAANSDPATRFIGVAPSAKILSIRQGSSFYSVRLRSVTTGEESYTPLAGDTISMAQAVVRAVQGGATVINISEAACFPAEPNQVNAQDLQAAVHYAVESNVVVVVAAANISDQCQQNTPGQLTTISSPGWFDDDVLTVAATNKNDEAAEFSIRGPWVDVAAPGTGAVSLDVAGPGLTTTLVTSKGQRNPIDGTSFAAPYVAGLAALVQERFPDLTARQIMHRIERTAQGTAGPGGRNDALGYGIINPVAALTAVLPEEAGITPERTSGGPLTDVILSPPEDPRARTVALAGAGAAVGLLGLTMLIVYTIKWHRQHRSR
ncbi:MAG: type VII secretion-associated serine protease mycosin [Pseudonocardiaceae bacterium]